MAGMADGTAGMILGYGTVVMLGVGEDLGDGIAGDGIMAGATVGITGAGMPVGAMAGTIGAGLLVGVMAITIGVGTTTTDLIVMHTMQEEEAQCSTIVI